MAINHSNRKSADNQLSLFGSSATDDRALPEIIAAGGTDWQAFPFQFQDVGGKRYYAVQDWIAGVSGSDNPRRIWTDMKARYKDGKERTTNRGRKPITPERAEYVKNQLVHLGVQLKYRASNGKNYDMDFITDEGLYLITQLIETESVVRESIIIYLAKAGVALDEIRRDPDKAVDLAIAGYERRGRDQQWIEARFAGKFKRHLFTDALQAAIDDPNFHKYGTATDLLNVGLFERTAETLKDGLGLSERSSLRDHISSFAISFLSLAESAIAQELGSRTELTWPEARQIILDMAAIFKPQIDALSARWGVDIVTGKKRIG